MTDVTCDALHARVLRALRLMGGEGPVTGPYPALASIAVRHAPSDRGEHCLGCHGDFETWVECPDFRDVAAAVGVEVEG